MSPVGKPPFWLTTLPILNIGLPRQVDDTMGNVLSITVVATGFGG